MPNSLYTTHIEVLASHQVSPKVKLNLLSVRAHYPFPLGYMNYLTVACSRAEHDTQTCYIQHSIERFGLQDLELATRVFELRKANFTPMMPSGQGQSLGQIKLGLPRRKVQDNTLDAQHEVLNVGDKVRTNFLGPQWLGGIIKRSEINNRIAYVDSWTWLDPHFTYLICLPKIDQPNVPDRRLWVSRKDLVLVERSAESKKALEALLLK